MPYTIQGQERLIIGNSFGDLLNAHDSLRQIDITAIVEFISRYHFFGDRTLIQGISRTPWMARPDARLEAWIPVDVPPHGQTVMRTAEAAQRLSSLLRKEIIQVCSGKSTIGILLSGGMDSRIVAGILDAAIKDGELQGQVVALTWGIENSRDVEYARQIAELLSWDWLHLPLSAENLRENISVTAARGCEFSPVHLHAMPRVRDQEGIDLIVAASFGDSIGRAEYSGRHVSDLLPIDKYVMNWFKLLLEDAYQAGAAGIPGDVQRYRERCPRDIEYQYREIERQVHYMRRQLNPCMAVINERIPLYQLFTAPETFGFMWSLAPEVRNDSVYFHMLNDLQKGMMDIPWARTGTPYFTNQGQADDLGDRYHKYGQWIREDMRDEIGDRVLSDSISDLGIFNMTALANAWRMNKVVGRGAGAMKLDEIFIWLAALSECVEMYGLRAQGSSQGWLDQINGALVAPAEAVGHTAVNVLRRL